MEPTIESLALPRHGGDLAAGEARFGRPSEGWLDLSTGINPFAYPLPDIPAEAWRCLPDGAAELALCEAAAAAWGVGDPRRIVPAAGTQAIIQLLPLLRPYGEVAVVGPTYEEHAASFGHAGHLVRPCGALEDIGEAQVVVVVNPNNPDGRRFAPDQLLDLAATLAAQGGLLIVDEAFVDLTPELSVAGRVGPGLLVLRSFGKFFGLAGLRLGFAVAEPPLADLLRQAIGPWAVSGPAIAIGRAALADTAWSEGTRARLRDEAALLDALLTGARLSILGGTDLFRLANASRAWALYEHLGARGILVRPFAGQPRWLRFGLPPGEEGRHRLAQALREWEG